MEKIIETAVANGIEDGSDQVAGVLEIVVYRIPRRTE